MASDDNIIHLAFRNDKQKGEIAEHMSCSNCKNKTFTHTYYNGEEFPTVECCACGQILGNVGWVDYDE